MTEHYRCGVIHGRFQPLHKGHLAYLLAGKARCDFLVVGITNPDPSLTAHHDANPHRSTKAANPFTFFERERIVRAALLEAGLGAEEFTVVPLPINKPDLIPYYVPTDVPFFMTIYDEWGHAKRKMLQSLGLRVVVMWEKESRAGTISSTEIRKRMARGEAWEALVPDAAVRLIKQMQLDDRVRQMTGPPP